MMSYRSSNEQSTTETYAIILNVLYESPLKILLLTTIIMDKKKS